MMRRVALAVVVAVVSGTAAASSQSPAQDTTVATICGTDDIVASPYPVTWPYVVLAGDSRGFYRCSDGLHTPEHREAREARVIRQALISKEPWLRRLSARAISYSGDGLPQPSAKPGAGVVEGALTGLLRDREPEVRAAAARALGHGVAALAARGRQASLEARLPQVVALVRARLETQARNEPAPTVLAAIYESLGTLPYSSDDDRNEVEIVLTEAAASGGPSKVLGAAKGLEALIRGNPKRVIAPETRVRLRQLARIGARTAAVPTTGGDGTAPAPGDHDDWGRTRRLAHLALQQARDDDTETIRLGATDGDWQVRRLAAARIDLAIPELTTVADLLSRDVDFHVRYEILGPMSRQAQRTRECDGMLRMLDDQHPAVAMRAMEVVRADCAEADAIAERLERFAIDFKNAHPPEWHLPTRALSALARISPDRARAFVEMAATHPVWQVRAAAAAVGATLKAPELVLRFAEDPHPNVRNAMLEALRRLEHPALGEMAVAAFQSDDHQLVRTAANLLPVPQEADRDHVSTAMLNCLRRLTQQAADTSRDPRLALIQKLERVLPRERAAELGMFASDVDRAVRAAAVQAYIKLVEAPIPPAATPLERYPLQPTVDELNNLPTSAEILMRDGGTMRLDLYVLDAPVTIARFARLARSGYYNGLTFHRVVPNFVVQGGSPGANEYVGVARYMRDEVGRPHVRGAVGISTRGRDTGDGQIFIDLVDLPRLDQDYTVFGRVISGLDVLDRILEGAVIQTVTVK